MWIYCSQKCESSSSQQIVRSSAGFNHPVSIPYSAPILTVHRHGDHDHQHQHPHRTAIEISISKTLKEISQIKPIKLFFSSNFLALKYFN